MSCIGNIPWMELINRETSLLLNLQRKVIRYKKFGSSRSQHYHPQIVDHSDRV